VVGGAIFSGNISVYNGTFSGNSSNGQGGAIISTPGGTLTAYNNIFTRNPRGRTHPQYGGAGISNDEYGTVNSSYNLFYQNLDAGSTEDDCNNCTSNTNSITGSNPNLLPLGYYGGPTETVTPQPGSPAICAASASLIPSAVTTDQRGFSRTTDYNSTACVDLGAVQTDYTAVAFSSSSYAGVETLATSPAPVVTVTENGQDIGGVPITPGYSGTGSPTGLGTVTTVGGTGASFNSFTAPLAAQGTLSVSLPITASGNSVQPAALTATASLNIQMGAQTITFVQLYPVTYPVSPITLSATGGAPSASSLDLGR
jgi:predicted outer membrane repeat protein